MRHFMLLLVMMMALCEYGVGRSCIFCVHETECSQEAMECSALLLSSLGGGVCWQTFLFTLVATLQPCFAQIRSVLYLETHRNLTKLCCVSYRKAADYKQLIEVLNLHLGTWNKCRYTACPTRLCMYCSSVTFCPSVYFYQLRRPSGPKSSGSSGNIY